MAQPSFFSCLVTSLCLTTACSAHPNVDKLILLEQEKQKTLEIEFRLRTINLDDDGSCISFTLSQIGDGESWTCALDVLGIVLREMNVSGGVPSGSWFNWEDAEWDEDKATPLVEDLLRNRFESILGLKKCKLTDVHGDKTVLSVMSLGKNI
jgi:hypothetical protein